MLTKRSGSLNVWWVCCSQVQGVLVSETLEANSLDEASKAFEVKYNQKPRFIHGPFLKKRSKSAITNTSFKITNQIKKAEYDGWLVNCVILKEPNDSALLTFISRLDGKKGPSPGTMIVPINELRIINE